MSARGRRGLLGLAFLVAAIGAFGASQHPDTLESFLDREGAAPEETAIPAPLSDYQVPGVRSEGLSRLLAGAAGVLATFGIVTLVAALAGRSRARRAPPDLRAS